MRHVSSRPPFSTGRAAFTASGAAPEVLLHVEHGASVSISVAFTDVHLCLIPFPQPTLANSEGTACAFAGYCVRHVPLYSVLPQARGLRHQSSSWCTQLSWAQTIMPHPTPQEGIGISYGSRLPTSTCLGILPEVSRVHTVGLKRDDVGGVFLDAPSALCGSRDCLQGRTRLTCTVPITLTPCAMSHPTASIYD